jgi:glycosyltransferase involved in cell wall biosynthesis
MPLRILLDARHIRDFGIGTYIRNLLRGMAEIGTKHKILLAAYKQDQHEFDDLPPNFKSVWYPRSDKELADQIAFPLFVRRLKPDLTHIPLSAAPILTPRPYVVTVHDLSALVFDTPSGWKHELRMLLMRRSLLRAARVITVSESTKDDVVQIIGIPEKRVVRIYGAADPRYIQQTPGEAARAAGPEARHLERLRILERYQVNYPYLLFAGTIRPQKNIPRLVEAFALVRGELENHPEYRDLRLLIIGDEISSYPAVRQAVIQSRVQQAVRFLGFVPFSTLRVFYEAAAAFVFPSLYEGFGLPPLEAMASGTPVVCSNATSLPEVVDDAALVVNPENVFEIARGIREVLLDSELRASLIERGRAQCQKFTWRDTAEKVLQVYEETARKPS